MSSHNDFIPVVRGPLKLKGTGLIGVQKKKKKKKKKNSMEKKSTSTLDVDTINSTSPTQGKASSNDNHLCSHNTHSQVFNESKISEEQQDNTVEKVDEASTKSTDDDPLSGKTPSERAFEEMRKKRLMDRLAKEGLKTHKQRVEELNKYLSNLSEHHDMYEFPEFSTVSFHSTKFISSMVVA